MDSIRKYTVIIDGMFTVESERRHLLCNRQD